MYTPCSQFELVNLSHEPILVDGYEVCVDDDASIALNHGTVIDISATKLIFNLVPAPV